VVGVGEREIKRGWVRMRPLFSKKWDTRLRRVVLPVLSSIMWCGFVSYFVAHTATNSGEKGLWFWS
jgi:hypothetical protein